jgi:aldehyde dehydrogenase (NAD+)
MTAAASATQLQDQTNALHSAFARQQTHQYVVARTKASERIAKLQRLHDAILSREKEIETALWLDLHKGSTETGISEIGMACSEIRHTIRHLRGWMTPRRVATPLTLFGSSSYIHYEPKGVCLIISPWNYPINLTFIPLVSAIAAGNTAILKPSEFTPHCAALMQEIVAECFPPEEVCLFQGDAEVAKALLALPFNHVFFTGSPAVGKIVMRAASEHLSSVTLELGGKSPVIVDASADLDTAAAKVAWAKCMNAGQICISPDYVLVHRTKAEAFAQKVIEKIKAFYGQSMEARAQNPDMCRIVTERHHERVTALLEDALQRGATLLHGGQHDRKDKYMDPAVLTNIPEGAKIWQEEIFGPLLPIRTFDKIEEATDYVNRGPKPLALYIFSTKGRDIDQIIAETRSGGVAVNDCASHFSHFGLPFGGSNNSGIGKTHGEFGFRDFSNERGVLRQTRFFPTSDLLLPPYGGRLAKIIVTGLKRYF